MYDPEEESRLCRRSPWYAAYRDALDNEGMSEVEARKYADRRLEEIQRDRADDAALDRYYERNA